MDYRGVEIELSESTEFAVKRTDFRTYDAYTVTGQGFEGGPGLVFSAKSKYGVAYALDPVSTLAMAKNLIDRNLDS